MNRAYFCIAAILHVLWFKQKDVAFFFSAGTVATPLGTTIHSPSLTTTLSPPSKGDVPNHANLSLSVTHLTVCAGIAPKHPTKQFFAHNA